MTQSRADKDGCRGCCLETTCEPGESSRRVAGDVDLSRYVAETADRLAEVSSGIQGLLPGGVIGG